MISGAGVHMAEPCKPLSADCIDVLGYRFHPRTGDEVVAALDTAIGLNKRLIVANANLHGMAVMFDSKPMANLLLQPDCIVLIDSMPVLFLANLFGHRLSRKKRATSLDFYDDMFRLGVQRGWSFGYVGGDPQDLRKGIDILRQRFPGIQISGRSGFFEIAANGFSSDEMEILEWLKVQSHDVLIIGMGMPRQEEWIAKIQSVVPTRAMLTAGAYMDYQVGVQSPAPRWMGQIGAEWLYRLVRSPRRLGYRYVVEPAVLAFRFLTRRHPQAR